MCIQIFSRRHNGNIQACEKPYKVLKDYNLKYQVCKLFIFCYYYLSIKFTVVQPQAIRVNEESPGEMVYGQTRSP